MTTREIFLGLGLSEILMCVVCLLLIGRVLIRLNKCRKTGGF
jgi:hypothetical protein